MESIRKQQEKEKTEYQSIHLLPGNLIFVQSKVTSLILEGWKIELSR